MLRSGVGRGVLGDVADLGQLGRVRRRAAAADLDGALGRLQHPDGQVEQRRLAGAVRTDEAGDVPSGMSSVQFVSAQVRR